MLNFHYGILSTMYNICVHDCTRILEQQKDLEGRMNESSGQRNALRLRQQLHALEQQSLAGLASAEQRLVAAQTDSHAVLAQHADLQANLTAADSLVESAQHQIDAVQCQLDMAVQVQAFEEAAELKVACTLQ